MSAEKPPRWRPVKPWQHWRFAFAVTLCWVARRHFLRLERRTEYGHVFYVCRVCRSSIVHTGKRRWAREEAAS